MEESDILGQPCLVKLGLDEYEDKKTGEPRQAWKVFTIYPWSNGSRKDPDEFNSDVPF